MYIINALVYTDRQEFAPLTVQTRGEQIIALLPPDAALESGEEIVDASGCYCIPGLTDIHFHGCNGYDFCDGTAKAYQAMADFELEHLHQPTGIDGLLRYHRNFPAYAFQEKAGHP